MSGKGTLYMLHMMSAMMPIEAQIEKVEEAIHNYKMKALINNTDEESKGELLSSMTLLMMGLTNQGKSMGEVMKQADLDSSKIDTIENIYHVVDSKNTSGQN